MPALSETRRASTYETWFIEDHAGRYSPAVLARFGKSEPEALSAIYRMSAAMKAQDILAGRFDAARVCDDEEILRFLG